MLATKPERLLASSSAFHRHAHCGAADHDLRIGESRGVAAAHDPPDGAFTADRRNLDRTAVVQLDDQGYHGRSEREVAPFHVSSAALDMLADGEFDDVGVRLEKAANVGGEGGEQKVARKGAVEPVELVDGFVTYATKPPSYVVQAVSAVHYARETGFNRG